MASKSSEWRPGPSICRCCFAEGCYKDISTEYFWMGKREVYSEMLTETFDVTIGFAQTSGPNSNSRLICEPCISRLRDASDFKKQVQECERIFQQHLANPDATLEFEVEPDKEEVKLERVKLEKQVDDDDDFDDRVGFPDSDDDDMDDEPLTKFASKVPKEEESDDDNILKSLLQDSKSPVKRKAATKVKASPSKKIKKKESPQPTASVSKAATKTVAEKKKKDIDRWGVSAGTRNAAIILRNSTAYPLQLCRTLISCVFCLKNFNDPDHFRSHIDTKHANTDKSYIVSDEFQIRVDITNLKCKCCPKSEIFDNLTELIEHLNGVHHEEIDLNHGTGLVPLKLSLDRFNCVTCGKNFKSLVSLSRHAGTHYTRHVCEACGKKFVAEGGLERHIMSCKIITGGKYYCNYCRNHFPTLQDKKDHILDPNNFRCKSYKCRECVLGFSSWEGKQAHMEEVHGIEKAVFKCVQCKQEFPKRIHLYLHFKRKHTEDLKCKFCGKTFGVKRGLMDHMNMHLSAKPYKCTFCDLCVTTDKSLRQHMKLHDDSKKLSCPSCGKLFARRSSLRDHLRRHHPELQEQLG